MIRRGFRTSALDGMEEGFEEGFLQGADSAQNASLPFRLLLSQERTRREELLSRLDWRSRMPAMKCWQQRTIPARSLSTWRAWGTDAPAQQKVPVLIDRALGFCDLGFTLGANKCTSVKLKSEIPV